jgi:hypothetical protein
MRFVSMEEENVLYVILAIIFGLLVVILPFIIMKLWGWV